jgi:hypothetical protein
MTYDDATSPKDKMKFDKIIVLIDLSTKCQLKKLSM